MVEQKASEASRIVALLSDFGHGGFYAGVMKAAVHRAAPQVQLVDITHDVTPHDVREASFILARVFEFFPEEAIFIAVVDPGVGGDRRNLAFRIKGRFLVAPDNGLVSDLVLNGSSVECRSIGETCLEPYRHHTRYGRTFLGRDIFAPAAGALACGMPFHHLGEEVEEFTKLEDLFVGVENNRIRGCGRYVDCFGNVLTGITASHLKRAFGARLLDHIRARVGGRVIEGILESYAQASPGTLLAVLNSWDLIEVSINQGRAVDALSISKPQEMVIELEA